MFQDLQIDCVNIPEDKPERREYIYEEQLNMNSEPIIQEIQLNLEGEGEEAKNKMEIEKKIPSIDEWIMQKKNHMLTPERRDIE